MVVEGPALELDRPDSNPASVSFLSVNEKNNPLLSESLSGLNEIMDANGLA